LLGVIFKYADDTNLLVPELTDVELCDEFLVIQNWAQINKMIINIAKTSDILVTKTTRKLCYSKDDRAMRAI